jgi:hypothetical protein
MFDGVTSKWVLFVWWTREWMPFDFLKGGWVRGGRWCWKLWWCWGRGGRLGLDGGWVGGGLQFSLICSKSAVYLKFGSQWLPSFSSFFFFCKSLAHYKFVFLF